MKLNFDISQQEFLLIRSILNDYLSKDCKVWVFGSRSKNKSYDYSDLDLAIDGNQRIDKKVIYQLKDAFEKAPLPYQVDVLDLSAISSSFKIIIDQQKVLFPLKYSLKVPKLRFKEFEDDWVEKKLGEVGNIITGKTPNTNKKEYWNGNIAFITPTDIIEGEKYQIRTQRTITKQKNTKVLPIGSIIYTCIASIGKLVISNKVSTTNQQINSIIVNNDVNNEYIYYFLLNLTPYIKSTQANTTLPIINKKEFSKFKVFIPSLSEQTKIANFLSEVDKKIEKIGEKKRLVEEYKKGVMQKIFSQKIRFKDDKGKEYPDWVEKKLGEVGCFYRGHNYTSENVKKDGLLVLRSSNIRNNFLILDKDLQFVNIKCSDGILLKTYDIVICMANGSKKLVGKSGMYLGNYDKDLTVGAFCSIFRSNNLLSKYLFQTVQYRKYLHIMLEGTNINNLKNSEICKLLFSFPSLPEQTKIANFLSEVDKKIEIIEKKKRLVEEYKKGLMQQMFV